MRRTVGLKFGWEPLSTVFAEPNLPELLKEHWHDLGVHKEAMRLDPDWQRYRALEEAGIYHAWTARDGKALAGYVGWFVQPHLHYKSTLTAADDLYLLSAAYRRGTAGLRMLSSSIEALKKLGVQRVIVHSKVHFEAERGGLGPLFRRLGFEHMDEFWSRML